MVFPLGDQATGPLRMSGVERIGDLDAQIKRGLDLQRLASDPVPERLPFQHFHGDEGLPISFVNLVDRANVRVIQGRRRLGLPPETAKGLCVVGEFVGKELQGYEAAEPHVLSLVHDAHTPTAQFLDDAVVRDGSPDHRREFYVCETCTSMKAVELAVSRKGCWRKIAISLIDQRSKRVIDSMTMSAPV